MKFFTCAAVALLIGAAAAAPFEATTHATTVTTGLPPIKFPECDGRKEGTLIGDHNQPEIFYECLGRGKAYKFHCPKGLIFVEKEKSCGFDPDHPNLITHAPSHHSKFDCTEKKDGMYVDPKDPTKFHQCENGVTYDFNCPEETMFDENKKVCVYDDNWHERTHEPTEPTKKSTEEMTTHETTTTEEPTTHETTTHEASTTQETTTPEASTTQETTTAEATTTEEPTTTEATTTEATTTQEPPTTTEKPTTTEEPTTTAEPTPINEAETTVSTTEQASKLTTRGRRGGGL